MDIIQEVVDFMGLAVEAIGVVVAAYGGINFFEGASQQAAAKKLEGLQFVVGGVGIFFIGLKIIPLILTVLSV